MYKWILNQKEILNKREYLGPVWPADVLPANDIPFCSILTYFQYSLIHDLALNAIKYCKVWTYHTFLSQSRTSMLTWLILNFCAPQKMIENGNFQKKLSSFCLYSILVLYICWIVVAQRKDCWSVFCSVLYWYNLGRLHF